MGFDLGFYLASPIATILQKPHVELVTYVLVG